MDGQEEESELLIFPNLVTTLETLLQETNLLKYNLCSQIKEANNLTEWELPGDTDNESDEQIPLEGTEHFDEAPGDSVIEEIVSESISNAIERAQTVRRSLSLNKSGNKVSKTKLEQNDGKVAVKPKVGSLKHKTLTIKTTRIKSAVKIKPATPEYSSNKNQKGNSSSKTDKKGTHLLPKRKSTHLQSTYQIDYSSVAKQMQSTNSKSVTSKNETTKQSESQVGTDSNKSKVFNFTDIDNLLSRVTPYPCANSSSQGKKSLSTDKHIASREEVGVNKRRMCKARTRQIDKLKLKKKTSLKEAIDVLGVPSELDSVLKVYHKYLDHKKYYSDEEGTLKNEFCSQLNAQNKSELINGFSHEPDMQAKVEKLLSIAKNMEEDRNIDFKLDVKSTNDLIGDFNSNEDLCLYYSGKEQLEMLEMKQDELMQLKLKLKICDSMLNDLNSSEFEEKHIVNVYKVVAALKDINLLSVPVIFRK